ncbi:M3 family metallopeptidase [Deinococcus maricopensis]|uniref:oligopeptidase A n=1 Tax=Deinococcus maricopensis (strain DSM 21211 / LMG 22137 / NRRL B-23946 / LB-34) TaxID=709986 RepID=E8U9H4_DEIML|nr:M3 family metallopeptidase [Deinococcus maricopensis]ADV67713.1 Oligopeptidase A [Deinococcus maricopensis DSM 21211]
MTEPVNAAPGVDAENPLLNLGFRIPFDRIQPEHALPAMQTLIDAARTDLERLARAPERNFEGFLDDLDRHTLQIQTVATIVGHLNGVVSSDEWRAAEGDILPLYSAFFTDITLHEGLWQALKAYAETPEAQALTGERARFLKLTMDEFRRNGADLDDAGKARLKDINVRLAELTKRYAENVMDGVKAFELYVPTERLAGVPERVQAATRADAEANGHPGEHRLTLHMPTYLPVLTYADDRALREELTRAYNRTGIGEGRDNRDLLPEILQLRQERAQLLGYRDFADLVTEDRMAGSGERAKTFLQDLEARTRPAFERENAELEAYYRARAGADAPALQPWDVTYWAEKQRAELYDFDEEELRPYFQVDSVLSGMFEVARRVFGLEVTPADAPGWHPDVRYFDLKNSEGEHVASFYTDWFPRNNKRGGAWMNAFVTGGPSERGFEPHIGLMCGNMTPPSPDAPALLSHDEVQTVFHEFGHLLHHALSRVEVRSLSGTNVAWDFVELPSQIMENWTWDKQALDLFARHFETGDVIPQALYDKMLRARNYRAGNFAMRQYSFGTVDLALHTEYTPQHGDVVAYTYPILARFAPVPMLNDNAFIAQFSHLFANPVGYASGYYSYKWAEVLEADAFSRFEQEGVFNADTGRAFVDNVLSRGNGEDPGVLFRTFLGRDPDANALLRRSGLTE